MMPHMEVIDVRIDYRPFTGSPFIRQISLAGANVSGISRSASDGASRSRASLRSLATDPAAQSAQDAIAMVRAADGSLAELEAVISRMRTLVLHAASDTATYEDRRKIASELEEGARDADRIVGSAKFNGHSLLDGTAAAAWASDRLSTRAYVRGTIRRADGSSLQGNYKITADLISPGVAQTQSAGSFRIKVSVDGTGGTGEGGGVTPAPQDKVVAYNMPKGDFTLNVFEERHGEGFGEEQRTTALFSSGGYHINKEYVIDGGNRKGKMSGIVADYYGNREFDASGRDDWGYGIFIYDDQLDNRAMFQSGTIDTIDHGGHKMNVQLYFVVTDKDEAANTVTFDVKAHGMTEWGVNVDLPGMQLTATTDGLPAQDLEEIGLVIGDGAFAIGPDSAKRFQEGDSFVISMAAGGDNVEGIMIMGEVDQDWEGSWKTSSPPMWGNGRQRFFGTVFSIRPESVNMQEEFHFRAFYLNTEDGTLYDGDLVVRFGDEMFRDAKPYPLVVDYGGGIIDTFPEYSYLQIAEFRSENIDEPEPIPDIKDGSFDEIVLSDETLLTISLGSGESTHVRLYKEDTVGAIADKLNDAVKNVLELAGYAPEAFGGRFVEFIQNTDIESEDLGEGVKILHGTYWFRSPLPGDDGRIVVAGPDHFIDNFALQIARAAEESRFKISVRDAHTGKIVVQDVKVTGSMAVGLIGDAVDVKFDPLADTIAVWDEREGRFLLRRAGGAYSTVVHLADRTTAFAIGEPSSHDALFDVGDVTTDALGIGSLLVTTRREAVLSLARIDSALARVRTLRARLGASESRLSTAASSIMSSQLSQPARLDSRSAEELLAQMKISLIAHADTAVPAAASLTAARIAALVKRAA